METHVLILASRPVEDDLGLSGSQFRFMQLFQGVQRIKVAFLCSRARVHSFQGTFTPESFDFSQSRGHL